MGDSSIIHTIPLAASWNLRERGVSWTGILKMLVGVGGGGGECSLEFQNA